MTNTLAYHELEFITVVKSCIKQAPGSPNFVGGGWGRGVSVTRFLIDRAGNPYRRGSLGTVDLLVLTQLDQLIFILKILFTSFTKQETLMRRTTLHKAFPLVSVPWTKNLT